jgi:hypothetical protein
VDAPRPARQPFFLVDLFEEYTALYRTGSVKEEGKKKGGKDSRRRRRRRRRRRAIVVR